MVVRHTPELNVAAPCRVGRGENFQLRADVVVTMQSTHVRMGV